MFQTDCTTRHGQSRRESSGLFCEGLALPTWGKLSGISVSSPAAGRFRLAAGRDEANATRLILPDGYFDPRTTGLPGDPGPGGSRRTAPCEPAMPPPGVTLAAEPAGRRPIRRPIRRTIRRPCQPHERYEPPSTAAGQCLTVRESVLKRRRSPAAASCYAKGSKTASKKEEKSAETNRRNRRLSGGVRHETGAD